jgi:hypothetical protein
MERTLGAMIILGAGPEGNLFAHGVDARPVQGRELSKPILPGIDFLFALFSSA